jgi:hypothetical protein
MRNTDTSQAILSLLFGGKIPVDRLDDLPAINADISALINRAKGGALVTTAKGTHRRLGPSSEESARITARVIELRGEGPRKGGLLWGEIAAALTNEGIVGQNGHPVTKDSCRHRFMEAKKRATTETEVKTWPCIICGKPTVYGGACSEECGLEWHKRTAPPTEEVPTDRNCQMVEETATVQEAAPVCLGTQKPTLTQEELDQLIYEMRDRGMKLRPIAEALEERGITMLTSEINYRLIARGRIKRLDAKREAAKNVAEKAATKPQIDFDAAVDSKILAMKKRDLPDIDIAQALERNPGGRWSGPRVAARYAEMQKEGER